MKTHLIKVAYTVEITAKERRQLLKIASSKGLDYGNPKPSVLLKRLFQDEGDRVLFDIDGRLRDEDPE